jgi:antitoxin MazE
MILFVAFYEGFFDPVAQPHRILHVYPGERRYSMQVQVARWGNSLGLRIPKHIAERTGLREGARVEVEAEGDRIVITRARPRHQLAELLKGMTPEAMRDAFDWGPDRGREIVE